MACMNRIIVFSPLYQSCRSISLSAWCFRKKPTPVRDSSKRNFQGEQLEEYMQKRAAAIEALQPFQNAVNEVIARFKLEVEEKERQKHDMQGEIMKRELAEREQAVQNYAIIAKNNAELRRKREIQKLIDEEEARRNGEEAIRLKKLEDEKLKEKNTAIVLNVIKESKDFITFDNMDEKIDEALENMVNFNYCITSEGRKIYSTKPPGNLDGWKGAGPMAYISGGIAYGTSEFQSVFKGRDLVGFNLKRRGLDQSRHGHSRKRNSEEAIGAK